MLKEIWKVTRSRLVSHGAEDSLGRHDERWQIFPSYLLPVQTEEQRKQEKKENERRKKEKKRKNAKLEQEVIRDFTGIVIFTLPESLPLQFKIIAP